MKKYNIKDDIMNGSEFKKLLSFLSIRKVPKQQQMKDS